MEAKGLKGFFNKAKAWFQKTIIRKPDVVQPQPPVVGGRGGMGRRGGGPATLGFSPPNDTVTDLSPYRIWTIPSDMRKELEKNAAK